MTVSMCLLVVFLSIWLEQSYRKEEQNLKTKNEFILLKASEEIKDSLWLELINTSDSNRTKIFEELIPERRKLKIKSLSQSGEDYMQTGRPQVDIKIAYAQHKDLDTLRTAINHILNQDTVIGSHINDGVSMSISMIEDKSIERLQNNGRPLDYNVTTISDMDSLHFGTIDLANNNIIRPFDKAIRHENYSTYIYKQLWPQLLFSLFLLGVVGGSFWLALNTIKKQSALSDMKSNFVSNMTHELKTPISTVSVAIEALQNFNVLDDKTKSQEYLDISKNELSRLGLLVDKVLKMSRFDSENEVLKKEEIDFVEILNNVNQSLDLQLKQCGADMKIEIDEGSYRSIGDRVHITNVFYNLIDNALKYSGDRPQISIDLKSLKDHIVIRIKDNGLGISKEFQSKVFDRFFRIPTGDVHDTKGHGLGLNYVKNIIEAHGGNIVLDSRLGQGSTFTIQIPQNV